MQEAISAGREIAVERLPASAGILPIAVPAFQLILEFLHLVQPPLGGEGGLGQGGASAEPWANFALSTKTPDG